jgi:hypothetical protein
VALGRYPGVRDVSLMAGVLPPHDDGAADIALDGVPNEALRQVFRHAVDGDFLRVLGIDLKWGRNLEPIDREGTPGVALVSESLARFLAGGDGRDVLGPEPSVRQRSPGAGAQRASGDRGSRRRRPLSRAALDPCRLEQSL